MFIFAEDCFKCSHLTKTSRTLVAHLQFQVMASAAQPPAAKRARPSSSAEMSQPKKVRKKKKAKRKKAFDMSRYHQRHIALLVAYHGGKQTTNYNPMWLSYIQQNV